MSFKIVESVVDAIRAKNADDVKPIEKYFSLEANERYHLGATDHMGNVAIYPSRTFVQLPELMKAFEGRHIYLEVAP